ncbi:MAG: hypothetical protein P4M01_00455 [Acidobacteriota bacterium]|nr:hypothetical protein [Acidobacteriota bacterium]
MSAFEELRGVTRLRFPQLVALVFLLGLVAAITFASKTTVRDPDIWWHMKVGDWIVANHAVPYTGILSRTGANLPWIAYSWGYEVMLSRAYAWFGLTGFSMFGVLLAVGVAYSLFWTLHRLSNSFWKAWLLACAGIFAYVFTLMPRPVFFTMIFFAVLMALLLEAQRTGRIQTLYWLPLLFMLWANIHIQFLYGLFAVGLLVGVQTLQRWGKRLGVELPFLEEAELPLGPLYGVFFASLAAVFVGPYSYHLTHVVFAYTNSHVPYYMIQELAAFSFNAFTHYILLLLACAGFYAAGYRGKLNLFKLLLLIVSSVIAFRTQRDAWFLGIAAAACIADRPWSSEEEHRPVLRLPELAGVVVAMVICLFLVGRNYDFNNASLDQAISRTYPVKAANFLRQNQVPGPLYNTLDWGGFLSWYLPQYPVVVDGRNDLYGDDIDLRTFKTVQGEDYTNDPYLNESGVVLLPKKSPLATFLNVDARFRLIYTDQLSAVFIRSQAPAAQ